MGTDGLYDKKMKQSEEAGFELKSLMGADGLYDLFSYDIEKDEES